MASNRVNLASVTRPSLAASAGGPDAAGSREALGDRQLGVHPVPAPFNQPLRALHRSREEVGELASGGAYRNGGAGPVFLETFAGSAFDA